MTTSWRKYGQLLKKRHRQEAGKFLVEGVRLCREALRSGWPVEVAFLSDSFLAGPHAEPFIDQLDHNGVPRRQLPDANLARLCDTESPQGIVLAVQMPEDALRMPAVRRQRLWVLVDGVRDPGNLGTLLRSADWFGADAVLLSADCVDPFNPKVVRGSMGSIFHLRISQVEDLTAITRTLQGKGVDIWAATLDGQALLHDQPVTAPVALLLGGEAEGVGGALRGLANRRVRIWNCGQAESLNVAVAGAIFLNHLAAGLHHSKPSRTHG